MNRLRSSRRALIFVLTLVFYSLLTISLYGSSVGNSSTPYYSYLSEAFLQGRTNLETPNNFDLSLFHGKLYMYWGYAPVVFITPFILLGLHSDVLYTLIAGALNAVLMYMLLKETAQTFKIKLSLTLKCILLLGFILATPNFYLSLNGRVWHTNQIISITYLLGYLILLLKYVQKPSIKLFAGAILFLNLTFLTRLNLGIYALLALYPIIEAIHNKKLLAKLFLVGALISGLSLTSYFAYNYARYGDVLEVGYRYHLGNERFLGPVAKNKLLSTDYLGNNLRYYFTEMLPISFSKPFVRPNPEGNSIFIIYPFTLLMVTLPLFLSSIMKKMKKKPRVLYMLVLSTTCLLTVFLLCFYTAGWVHFGNRYFLDIVPLMFMHLVIMAPYVSEGTYAFLLISGIAVNILGSIEFYQHILR